MQLDAVVGHLCTHTGQSLRGVGTTRCTRPKLGSWARVRVGGRVRGRYRTQVLSCVHTVAYTGSVYTGSVLTGRSDQFWIKLEIWIKLDYLGRGGSGLGDESQTSQKHWSCSRTAPDTPALGPTGESGHYTQVRTREVCLQYRCVCECASLDSVSGIVRSQFGR